MIAAPSMTPPRPSPAGDRLPTEAEARVQPDLVVNIDRGGVAPDDTHVASAAVNVTAGPTDLPAAGGGKPFRLPQPPDRTPLRDSRAPADKSSKTLPEQTRGAFDLLRWALRTYLRRPRPWLSIAVVLVLPMGFVESLLLAAVARGPDPATLVVPGVATVDLSESKAALARRIQLSQANGKVDAQAAAALAALTTVETAARPSSSKIAADTSWRDYAARFVAGLLLFGIAVPLAFAAMAIAAADEQGGGATPAMSELGALLIARRETFLLSLVPAALLVAVGHALFVVPGLLLAALFLFVPHTVVFEKRRGRAALERSIELVRADGVRVALTFVTLALAGFLIAVIAGLLLPVFGNRATVFLNALASTLVFLIVLPVPALALARIYFDLRARAGGTAERLSRAARS